VDHTLDHGDRQFSSLFDFTGGIFILTQASMLPISLETYGPKGGYSRV
jgi:hypothetical protein